jgi:peroxiredoxin Q/BCP
LPLTHAYTFCVCSVSDGADDAPSCSKELAAFEDSLPAFKANGVSVVGVRNPAGVKGYEGAVKVVVDDADAMRSNIGIESDLFGLLGGRESYVVDGSGSIVGVHNNQFDPQSHVTKSLEAAEALPKGFVEELAAKLSL